MRGSMVDI